MTETARNERTVVELDFSGCEFLTAEAVALVAGLFYSRRAQGFETRLLERTLSAAVSKNLGRIGLLELFQPDRHFPPGNSLPLHQQTQYDGEKIVRYIEREVMSRPQMPTLSRELSKEIRRSFAEIFGNVFHHSNSPIGGLVAGQVYPNRGEIQLTFHDAGVGICARVRSVVRGISDDPTAIQWALERGTSTIAISEGHPRGLGLYLLREFLRVNEGELQVYANGGYYRESPKGRTVKVLQSSLPGTLIDVRIRVREDVSYAFAAESM